MIQRIQSLWLLAAVILGIVVMCSQLGVIQAGDMTPDSRLYCLYLISDGVYNFSVAVLFLLMIIVTAIGAFTIFCFKKRKLQMRLCSIATIVCLMWYAALGEVWMRFTADDAAVYYPSWFIIALPLVMSVLFRLAYYGVKKDDDLVRSADRIR